MYFSSSIIDCPTEVNGEHWVLLIGDLHIDDPSTMRSFLSAKLAQAKERNANVFIGGDLFSMILPDDKKRYVAGDPSRSSSILNDIVDDAADFLLPFAGNIDVMLHGNHEASCIKYRYFDPIRTLAGLLDKRRLELGKPCVQIAGYRGFITMNYRRPNAKSAEKQYIIFANHGQGGASVRTKGALAFDIENAHINADAVWLNHQHTKLFHEAVRVYLEPDGTPVAKPIAMIRTAAFKEPISKNPRDYKPDFATERMAMPLAIGGTWLRQVMTRNGNKYGIRTEVINEVGWDG
jgi:hypothetical protein